MTPDMAAQFAVQFIFMALVLGLRFRQIDGRASPDCQYYLNIAVGRPTPKPYCYRVLVPWLTMLGIFVTPFKPINIMRVIVTTGIVGFLGVAYFLALHLGCTPWQATVVVIILISTDSLIGNWVMFPWLADPWAFAFAGMATMLDPIGAAVFLALSASAKEAGWILGTVAALMLGAPWWVPLPGLALLLLLRFILKAGPPDVEWLQKPFSYAQSSKRRDWFSYRKNLSGLKATPFVALWSLAGAGTGGTAAALAFFAWFQTLFAVDHGRLIACCTLWVVPMAVAVCPDNLLAVWVLAQSFWPTEQTEWV